MTSSFIKLSKLRIEQYKQYSGEVYFKGIERVKNSNYYVIDIPLDGEAPKQYIKLYQYQYNGPRKRNPKSWNGYYSKFGSKSYPHESIIEYGLNMIGEALGLKMNETKLVIINNQLRFLSKDFIQRGRTKLIHGVEILHEYFEDKDFVDEINKNRKTRREFFTFDVIENALKHVHPKQYEDLLLDLVKLITFDAIVGNNDRHFYNWGVIGQVEDQSNKKVEFAPIYDTARGLLWNTTDNKVKLMYQNSKHSNEAIEAFVRKSKPRFSFEGNAESNHFELIKYLAKRDESYLNVIKQFISKSNENKVITKLSNTIFRLLIRERVLLMEKIIRLRFEKLRIIVR